MYLSTKPHKSMYSVLLHQPNTQYLSFILYIWVLTGLSTDHIEPHRSIGFM